MARHTLKLNASPGSALGTLSLIADFLRWKLNLPMPRDFSYYKEFAANIFLTPAITCKPDSKFEVHILTCQRDFLEAMWALKTFYLMSGLQSGLVVHDDGSLTGNAVSAFRKHFRNCRIISRAEADKLLKKKLKNHSASFRYRFTDFRVHSMKLFDFYFTAKADILMLDSDVLFFKRPDELLRKIKYGKGFFMSDYRDAYTFTKQHLQKLFGINVMEKVNTGLLFFPKRSFDIGLVEKFLHEALSRMKHNSFPHKYWVEQTALALLISKNPLQFARLPSSYQISKQPVTGNTVSCHFVSDGSRHYFYTAGLRRLKEINFLNLNDFS